MSVWTQADAIELCRKVEAVAPLYGCHVALTGGLLYKNDPRKDADLVFYRIRQAEKIDVMGLFVALSEINFARVTREETFCIKALYFGKPVDCLFPEVEGEYPIRGDEAPEVEGFDPFALPEDFVAVAADACCANEKRNANGGCDNCGDPCL